MQSIKNSFRFIVVSIVLLFTMTIFISCDIKFKAKADREELPDFVIGDYKHISADNSGRKEFELKASRAKMYNAKNDIFLYNMTMIFYKKNGGVKSFLSADSGYANKASVDVVAEGNVKLLSDNKATLDANKVYWDNTKKIFYTHSNEMVTITRGSMVTRGYNLRTDNELKEVKLESPQTTIKSMKEK